MTDRTINIKLSTKMNSEMKKFCRYANLKPPTVMRFFLAEQLVSYRFDRECFISEWNHKRFKATEKNEGKDYSFKITSKMYDLIMDMKEDFKISLNELVVNLLRMELYSIFKNYDHNSSTNTKYILAEKYRSNISFSNVIKQDLTNISNDIGISLNSLITHVLIKYLIENYGFYYDGIFSTDGLNYYDGLW